MSTPRKRRLSETYLLSLYRVNSYAIYKYNDEHQWVISDLKSARSQECVGTN